MISNPYARITITSSLFWKEYISFVTKSVLKKTLFFIQFEKLFNVHPTFLTLNSIKCSDELKSIIPHKACFARSTRFADSQHSSAVKLEKCRTTSFANTFVSMTSRNWNSLPASIFPSTYNLQTFKTRVHKHLRLHPLT